MTAAQRSALTVTATGLAAVAAVWPLLALPAFLVVVLAFIVLEGRRRWITGALGGTLAMVAFTRFLLATAVPNIVIAGEMAAEDKAVDRLREIRWTVLQRGQTGQPVGDRGLEDLVGAYLDPSHYLPTKIANVFRCDSYLVTLDVRSTTAFVAYAWPVGEMQGGKRTFAIDEHDDICELDDPGTYVGPAQAPPVDASFVSDGSSCRPPWHVWKHKKSRQ